VPEEDAPPLPDELEVSVFGPGFGECILCHLGAGEWLIVDSCIDQQSRTNPALRYLEVLGVNPAAAVKVIVATHWHVDHVRGLADVVQRCENAQFFCSPAFGEDEALVFIGAHAPGTYRAGPREFYEVLTILDRRFPSGHVPAITPIRWAGHEKRLHHRPAAGALEAEVVALSPSDAAVTLAKRAFRELIPSVGDAPRHAVWRGPNHNAVVLWVRVGGAVAILGADLEEENHPQLGWTAIVNSFTREQAGTLKVPHHGSENGHHAGIWTDLLESAPIAVLTPFALGNVDLPTPADRRRIGALAGSAYITANQARYSPRRVDPVVDQTMAEATAAQHELYRRMGHVRLRRDGSTTGSGWRVDLFGSAELMRVSSAS